MTTVARGVEPDQRQQQADDGQQDGEREEEERHGQDGAGAGERPAGDAERRCASDRNGSRPVAFQMPSASHSRAPPSTAAKIAPIAPDAAAGDEIDLDAGFVQRAQHAGVVGAAGAGAGQHERGPEPRRILPVRSVGRDHELRRLTASSWIVTSFTSSNRRLPFGVVTVTSSPSSLLSSAAADRRRRRDHALLDVGVLRHDELVDRSSGRSDP